jgi:hypothetical protein
MNTLSYEDGFHLRLGRLTHAVASLDVNIGFSLQWVAEHYKQDVSDLLIGIKPMKLRLDKLESLIQETALHEQSTVFKQLSEWFKQAHEVRALRNDYVHARWIMHRVSPGEEPSIAYLPLTWESDPAALPQPIRVTFAELDQQVSEIRKLTNELYQLLVQHCSV